MLKRSMAFILSIMLAVTMLVVPGVCASADALDITDYIPQAIEGTMLDGKVIKVTSYNGPNYDYGVEIEELGGNISKFYTKDTRATIPSSVARPQGGLEYSLDKSLVLQGEKLVFVVRVRKVNEDDVVPNLVFGLADAAMGGSAAGWGWKGQTVYTFDVTSDEWQTVVQEIEIPYNATDNTKAVLGLGAGCTHDAYKGKTELEFRPGAAVEIDFSGVYLGKPVEGAYDMNFQLSDSEPIMGKTITGVASVVDMTGNPENCEQSFTYYVTDEEGNPVDGFEITEPTEGEVSIKPGSTVLPGNYVVLAVSDIYEGFQKALPVSFAYGDAALEDGSEIKITSDTDGVVGLTNRVTFTASVENNGEVVDYSEPFVWSAINVDKMSVCEDIALIPSEDTKSAELSMELSIPEGNYYIMAASGDMSTLFEITVDKSGDIENIISQITEKKNDDLRAGMQTYLAVLELSDSVAASADVSAFSEILISMSEEEDIAGYNTDLLKEYFVKCAVLSLYNKNENAVPLYDENGNFVFAEQLKLSEIDSGDITLWKLFGNDPQAKGGLLSVEGKKALHNALTVAGAKNLTEFTDNVKENILLYTLAYPNVMSFGYVETVLTKANLDALEISAAEYLALSDKDKANEAVAGTLYTIEELEKALLEASKLKKPSASSGNTGSSGGSSGSSGGGFVGSYTSSKNNKNEQKEENKENNETNKGAIDLDAVFTDLPADHWACGDVYFLRELGVVNGITETSFDPDGIVTREQFLKMLVTAFKISSASKDVAFTDVEENAWYAPYVKAGAANGIVNGLGDGSFGIGKPVTRQDACVMLVRVLGIDTSAETSLGFADEASIAPYAKSSIGALCEYSVINGFTDNTFRGGEICSRAQAAKIVSGAITIFNAIISGGGN